MQFHKFRIQAGSFISGHLFELDKPKLPLSRVFTVQFGIQATKSEAACPSGHNRTASCLLRHLSESYFIGLLIALML